MPIRLHEDGLTALFEYLKDRIPKHVIAVYPGIDPKYVLKKTTEKVEETSEVYTKSITFNYFFGRDDFLGSSPFSLTAEKKKGAETYSLTLTCNVIDQFEVEKKVTFIRMMIVDWDAQRK
jgi:hypothetical protein